MILASEKQLSEYMASGWWETKTLIDYFKEHVHQKTDRIALIDPLDKSELTGFHSERLTYGELDRAVDATATALINMGLSKDDVVIVQLPNCWELAMLYLAITRVGALTTPIPVQWRKRELEYIAGITEAKACITVNDLKGFGHREMFATIQSGHPHLKHIFTLGQIREMARGKIDGEKLADIELDANDIFTLCWTSGTETEPKGCPLSHNNWINYVHLLKDAMDIRPGDTLLTAGPLVNMASVGIFYIPWLVLGGTLVLHHPLNLPLLIKQVIEEKVNLSGLVPAVANIIVKHPQLDNFDLSSVRSFGMGSAPPSMFSMQEFKRRWGIDTCNIWGQNEGTIIASSKLDVPDMEKRVNNFPQFGKKGVRWSSDAASERCQTKLISPETDQEVTEVGQVGELAFKGPSVISSYYKRPELDAEAFDDDGYFYTGDFFIIKEDNCIEFFERKKDIIIRGGFNISTQEIENMLLAHPKVNEIAAVAMPDEVLGEKACVYVVPKTGENIALEELVAFMKEQGAAVYKTPERLEVIDSIPRNPVGKVLKKVLREDIRKKLKDEKADSKT